MSRKIVAFLLMSALFNQVWAGSLFDEHEYHPLAADNKAWRVGDNLTVLIIENAQASASANTSTSKEGSLSGNIKSTNTNRTGAIDLTEDFKGGGTVTRSGKLLAQVTVNVQAIQPNGDLDVKGEQLIELNNEKQHITLEGRIRPQDIATDNTVPSTRVSNTRISYVGQGVLGEKQRPGILTRLFTWLRIL
jgi:flagellar L-ring protein precursor FlgH